MASVSSAKELDLNDLAVVDGFDHTPTDTKNLVTFKINNQSFGIPILQVQDIVEPRR